MTLKIDRIYLPALAIDIRVLCTFMRKYTVRGIHKRNLVLNSRWREINYL